MTNADQGENNNWTTSTQLFEACSSTKAVVDAMQWIFWKVELQTRNSTLSNNKFDLGAEYKTCKIFLCFFSLLCFVRVVLLFFFGFDLL
jgi:hypothetical protein